MAYGLLSYDGEIENDGSAFELVPEGEHFYEVVAFNRKRGKFSFKDNGTQQIVEDCPYVEVALKVFSEDGRDLGGVNDNLYMHGAAEWKLCQFFVSIGLRKPGQKFKMDWNAALHKKGKLKIIHKNVPNRNDPSKTLTFANVEKYLKPQVSTDAPADDNPL